MPGRTVILGDEGSGSGNCPQNGTGVTHLFPFVGAGLSIPLKYPSWGGLLTEMSPDDAVRAKVNELLAAFQ